MLRQPLKAQRWALLTQVTILNGSKRRRDVNGVMPAGKRKMTTTKLGKGTSKLINKWISVQENLVWPFPSEVANLQTGVKRAKPVTW